MVRGFLNFLSQEKRLSTHTITSYRKDLEQLVSFLSSKFEIEIIQADESHLRSWIVFLSEKGLSSTSINRKIACTKSFYKYLVFRSYIKRNPSIVLKPLKGQKKLPQFVKEDDFVRLLDQMDFGEKFEGHRDKLMLEILYGTGIRLSELIGLKEDHVNLYEKTVKVHGKRNKERIIPLNNTLIRIIETYKKKKHTEGFESPYLLVTEKGNRMYPMFVYRKVKSYLSGVTTISTRSPHVIRHSFATHLLNRGAELNAVKDILGHTSLAATQVYTHNSIEKLKKAFDQAHPKA